MAASNDHTPHQTADLTPCELTLIYETLIKVHEAQGTWHWTRWSFFLAANSFLAVAAAQLLSMDAGGLVSEDARWVLLLGLGVVGAAVSAFWCQVSVHSAYFLNMRLCQLREIEYRLGLNRDKDEQGNGMGPFSRGAHISGRARAGRAYPMHFEAEGTEIPGTDIKLDEDDMERTRRRMSGKRDWELKPPACLGKASTITGKAMPGLFFLAWMALPIVVVLEWSS